MWRGAAAGGRGLKRLRTVGLSTMYSTDYMDRARTRAGAYIHSADTALQRATFMHMQRSVCRAKSARLALSPPCAAFCGALVRCRRRRDGRLKRARKASMGPRQRPPTTPMTTILRWKKSRSRSRRHPIHLDGAEVDPCVSKKVQRKEGRQEGGRRREWSHMALFPM